MGRNVRDQLHPDHGHLVEQCTHYLRALSTRQLIELLPVLVRHAGYNGIEPWLRAVPSPTGRTRPLNGKKFKGKPRNR
ncbi:MAG: hypothetical protein HOP29_08345 [Phycisphaerales bacterium]|nr:hypothetical protein [Phycisphaerales bacterium]